MIAQPLLKGGSVVQQVCRWLIPALFAILTFFCFMMLDWRNISWYDETFYIYNLLLFIVAFGLMALTAENKTLRTASWLLTSGYGLELVAYLLALSNHTTALFYSGFSVGLIRLIEGLLFLSGVMVLCSDAAFRSKAPRISLLYVFFLGCSALFTPLLSAHAISGTMISAAHDRIMGFFMSPVISITALLNTATAFTAILFWYFTLTGKAESDAAVVTNPFKLASVRATTIVIVISFVALYLYSLI